MRSYEDPERQVLSRLVREGLTALDVGAHHGFYTLLLSKLVGPTGRVIAFEPSPRERERLRLHVRLNGCRNVLIEPLAVGAVSGEVRLFVVEGRDTGLNSLRPPRCAEPVKSIEVLATTVDEYLARHGISRVDFVKIDAEGAELDVMKGAQEMLERPGRPLVLCEVQDVRAIPFGHTAAHVLEFMSVRGYLWFRVVPPGLVAPLEGATELARWGQNFLAVPAERAAEVQHLVTTSAG